MRVRLRDGTSVEARIKGKRQRPVCGDEVSVEPIAGEKEWLITAVGKRRNELTRPNRRGEAEVLAANIDQLCAVAAATPRPDWFIVDRYLGAAELMGVRGLVIINKQDLIADDDSLGKEIAGAAADYRQIGYAVIRCSAASGTGMQELATELKKRISIFVGQSGVGKSSLINLLLGESSQRTGDLSDKNREGRHTTVNSVMLELPSGGEVIDSPGVRDYAPAVQSTRDVGRGFVEISKAAADCRFADCKHMVEPGCAVRQSVDAGTISERRYESYRRLVILTAQLAERRAP
jgi:ribosome biogenesis GTPase